MPLWVFSLLAKSTVGWKEPKFLLVGKELSPVMKQVVESVKIIAILSFLSSKSCHFYFAILEQFYLSLLNKYIWEQYWAFCHQNHVISTSRFWSSGFFSMTPVESQKFAWHHIMKLWTPTYTILLSMFSMKMMRDIVLLENFSKFEFRFAHFARFVK